MCPEQQFQNGESEESHAQFLKALQNAVTTFVNRMKSNHVRGRSITNDSAVLSLFQSINSMHPQLLELLNQLDERRRRCRGARGTFRGGLAAPLGAVPARSPWARQRFLGWGRGRAAGNSGKCPQWWEVPR